MAKRNKSGHACLPDCDLTAFFRAIENSPTISPNDFFQRERLEEVAECPGCTSRVLMAYDLAVRVATPEEMLRELEKKALKPDARDGKSPADRMAELTHA